LEAFAGVVRDQDVAAASVAARDLLERNLSDTVERFNAGAATVADRAQVLARLSLARSQVSSFQGRVAQSRATYVSIFGLEPCHTGLPPALPALPATAALAVQAALRENPALRQAQWNEAAARARIDLNKSALGPSVYLKLSAASLPLDQYYSGLQDKNITASIVMQISLFDSGATLSKIRQAEAEAKSARLNMAAVRRAVAAAADRGFSGYLAAQGSVRFLEDQVKADLEAYAALNEQLKAGLVSTIELLNSEQELAGARVALANAKYDLFMSEADLLLSSGRLEPEVTIPGVRPRYPEKELQKTRILTTLLPTAMLVREIDTLSPGGWSPGRPAPVAEPAAAGDHFPADVDVDSGRLQQVQPSAAATP
jgi:outer membrane protein